MTFLINFMDYKDEKNDFSIELPINKNQYITTNKEKWTPKIFVDPGFVDFPQLSELNFKKQKAFEEMFELEFPFFIIEFMKESREKYDKENTNYFTTMFPKTKKDEKSPFHAAIEAANIISISPPLLTEKLIGTEFFSLISSNLRLINDQYVINITLNTILHFIKYSKEIMHEFVYNCNIIDNLINLISSTINQDIKANATFILTQFLKIFFGSEEALQVLSFLNNLAKENHKIYNQYLIIALHNITKHTPQMLMKNKLYKKFLLYLSQPDSYLCSLSAIGLLNYLKEMHEEDDLCMDEIMGSNFDVLYAISLALSKHHNPLQIRESTTPDGQILQFYDAQDGKTENIRTISNILNLFVEIISINPSLFNIDNEQNTVIHHICSSIAEILHAGSNDFKIMIIPIILELNQIIGKQLMLMFPQELDVFSALCSTFHFISDHEQLTKILVLLADFIRNNPETIENYGDEFFDLLNEIIEEEHDQNTELPELAESIKATIFPDS